MAFRGKYRRLRKRQTKTWKYYFKIIACIHVSYISLLCAVAPTATIHISILSRKILKKNTDYKKEKSSGTFDLSPLVTSETILVIVWKALLPSEEKEALDLTLYLMANDMLEPLFPIFKCFKNPFLQKVLLQGRGKSSFESPNALNTL